MAKQGAELTVDAVAPMAALAALVTTQNRHDWRVTRTTPCSGSLLVVYFRARERPESEAATLTRERFSNGNSSVVPTSMACIRLDIAVFFLAISLDF